LNNQIKTTWNIIKHEKVEDPGEIADAFNTSFLTITENLNLHHETGDNVISFLREAYPRIFPGIKTIPTTGTEIKTIIHSCLKTKKLSRLCWNNK
jgi:hypothetical protein